MEQGTDPRDIAGNNKADKTDQNSSGPTYGLGEATPTVGQHVLETWEHRLQAIVDLEIPPRGSIADASYWGFQGCHHLAVSLLVAMREDRMKKSPMLTCGRVIGESTYPWEL